MLSKSESKLWELVLFFYHVCPRDQIQVIRLAGKCFHPLIQLTDLTYFGLEKESHSVTQLAWN